jgi:hypothetical protein
MVPDYASARAGKKSDPDMTMASWSLRPRGIAALASARSTTFAPAARRL